MGGGAPGSHGSTTSSWPQGTRYFTRITEDDHSGWLWIITLMSLVYVIAAFIVRFVVKYGLYGNDDWALLASTVLAICQYIAVLTGLSEGLGKNTRLLSDMQLEQIQRSASAHVFLFILAHCMSKISTALLTLRLFETARARGHLLSKALIICSVLYGFGSILTAAIDCQSPGGPRSDHSHCSNPIVRWKVIFALDIITEALLVVVPLALVLQVLNKRSTRLTVAAIFACRLVDVVFAGLNLHRISLQGKDDNGIGVVPPMIWTQTELLWSIISASLPCLKAFVRPFDKIDEDTWRSGQGYSASRSAQSTTLKHVESQADAMPLEHIRVRKRSSSIPLPYGRLNSPSAHENHHGIAMDEILLRSPAMQDERQSCDSRDRIIHISQQHRLQQ